MCKACGGGRGLSLSGYCESGHSAEHDCRNIYYSDGGKNCMTSSDDGSWKAKQACCECGGG